jgi:hypothetical protein
MTRTLLRLLTLTLTVTLTATAQASLARSAETDLSHIRKLYKRWDKQREELMKTELLKASQPASEGSKAYTFRKSGKILIVDESYFADAGQSTWSFYYDSGRPFFVVESETQYAYPISVNAEERKKLGGAEDKTAENRYYINKGKLIRWLEGKKQIPTRGDRFKEQSKSVLELASSAYKNALTGAVHPK